MVLEKIEMETVLKFYQILPRLYSINFLPKYSASSARVGLHSFSLLP